MFSNNLALDHLIHFYAIICTFGFVFIVHLIMSIFIGGFHWGHIVSCFIRDYKAARNLDGEQCKFFTYLTKWIKQYLSIMYGEKVRNCKSCEFTVCPYYESSISLEPKPQDNSFDFLIYNKKLSLKSVILNDLYQSFLFGLSSFVCIYFYHAFVSFDSEFPFAFAFRVSLVICLSIFFLHLIVNFLLYFIGYCSSNKVNKK